MAIVLTTGTAACASVIGLDDLHRNSPVAPADAGGSTPTPGDDAAVPPPGNVAPPDDAGATLPKADAAPPPPVGDPTCAGKAGPPEVRVTSSSGSFCIDMTEVTNDQYAAFVSSSQPASFLPSSCNGRTADVVPAQSWPAPSGAGHQPVRFVDWCDAAAYCAWAGKALCKGSQSIPFDPTGVVGDVTGQWGTACLGASQKAYPYGSSYVQGTCNDNASGGGPVDVGSKTGCVGGVPGLFDMSGNVGEWEDACSTVSGGGGGGHYGGGWGGDTSCAVRGGAFDTASTSTELSCAGSVAKSRDTTAADIGFRCCSQ